jgi:hypothetical protein
MAHRWHEHLLHAIQQQDATEAEGAMFQHLDIMEKDLLARLPLSEDPRIVRDRYTHPLLADLNADKQKSSEAR